MNERIVKMLDGLGIPVFADLYTGDEPMYIVFNYTILPADYADDTAGSDLYLIQIHLFAPAQEDVLSIRRAIRKRIQEAGFDRPSETNVSDQEGQHFVYEMEEVGENGEN